MMNTGKRILAGALAVLLLGTAAAVVWFVQFTSLGYRMTVPLRDFEQIGHNIYVHRSFALEPETVLETSAKARGRVSAFFGDLTGDPVLILCDDAEILNKLGGDHDTATAVLGRAHSYTSLSLKYFNLDILAHEYTHGEAHARLYRGRFLNKALVPVWFDEGLALQNDMRENFSEETWRIKTEDGARAVPMEELADPAVFYAGTTEDRRFRYMLSRHEVAAWIAEYGADGLCALLEQINQGGEFQSLYQSGPARH